MATKFAASQQANGGSENGLLTLDSCCTQAMLLLTWGEAQHVHVLL
jgi:hypothetical protein